MHLFIRNSYLDSIGTMNIIRTSQFDNLQTKLENGDWSSILFNLQSKSNSKAKKHFPLDFFILINRKTENGICYRPRFLKVDYVSKKYENLFSWYFKKKISKIQYFIVRN